MFSEKLSIAEKFKVLQEIGYDGVELNSPGGVNKDEDLAASRENGFPINGVVDSIHWGTRLSSPDKATRAKGLEGLKTAIRDTSKVGGSAVLLVPGAVRDANNENHQQVWDRSIELIMKALPLAASRGIHILIENVWNGFLYAPKGDDNQSADKLVEYLDEINSPWVGSYFDIGNHQRFGKPAQWIRQQLHDGSLRPPHSIKGIVGAEMAQKDQHSLPARLAGLDEQNAFKIRGFSAAWPSGKETANEKTKMSKRCVMKEAARLERI